MSVAAARERARARLAAQAGTWAGALVEGAAEPELTIALKPPSEREMLADERAAEEWAREWAAIGTSLVPGSSTVSATVSAPGSGVGPERARSAGNGAGRRGSADAVGIEGGIEVEWVTRSWRSIGRQRVPVRVRLRGTPAVAAFAGGAAARDWTRLRTRALEVAERLGAPERPEVMTALASVVRRRAGDLAALDDDRFAQVVQVSEWIVANPVTGLRPRQVPVRGVDSKWLGRHRGLVTELVAAATGSADLGLLDADRLVRLRILDERLAIGGLRDLAAPAAQLVGLPVRPTGVFVFENLESVLAMPPWPGAIAVHGSGYSVDAVAALAWVRDVPIVYWGDLDSHGFAILHLLRAWHDDVTSVLMDEPTLRAHRDLWVPEPTPSRGEFGTLTAGERAALSALRAEGDVRLEQERIPWATALTALTHAWRQRIGDC